MSETSRTEAGAALQPPIHALLQLLDQLAGVVRSLEPDQYKQCPVGVFDSSIASHVRHSLQHIEQVVADSLSSSGTIDYDRRDRSSAIERSPEAALRVIDEFKMQLKDLSLDHSTTGVLTLRGAVSGDGDVVNVPTSVGRELIFCISHTIHHNAIIGAMVRTLGLSVPADFGYAPSTLLYMQQSECAR